MSLFEERHEVRQRAVGGIDLQVVGDVVSVVLQGGRIEREQPDRIDPQVLQVIELSRQPDEIPDAVPVAVGKSPDMEFVDDGVLVPERILGGRGEEVRPGLPAGGFLVQADPLSVVQSMASLEGEPPERRMSRSLPGSFRNGGRRGRFKLLRRRSDPDLVERQG
jgi:hypothetical protein